MKKTVIQCCCVCGHEARIESSKVISERLKQLYCGCKNPECGHTWVINLEFSHTLSPSAFNLPKELQEKVRTMPPMQQQSLFV